MAEISPKLKPHVPVDILLPEGGTSRIMGLVDTGNLVSPGLCFSEKYAREVGLKIEKLRPLSIGTAATGSTMALVGAVRNLRLKIGKVEVVHPISWVLRDLTSSMNIGYMFLRTHKLSVMLEGEEPVYIKKEVLNWCRPWHQGSHDFLYTPTKLSKLKLKTLNSRIKNVVNIVKKCLTNFISIQRKQSRGSYKGQLALSCQPQGKITPVKINKNMILLPKSMTKWSIGGIPKGCNSILVENMSFCSDNEVFGMPGVYPVRNSKAKIMVINLKEQPKLVRRYTPVEVNELKEGSLRTENTVTNLKDQPETDVNELYDKLKIEENEMLKKHPKIKKKLKSFIYRYRHIFATPEHEVGWTEVLEASIKVKEGTEPVYEKPRVINPWVKAEFQKQVNEWLKHKIVKLSKSP